MAAAQRGTYLGRCPWSSCVPSESTSASPPVPHQDLQASCVCVVCVCGVCVWCVGVCGVVRGWVCVVCVCVCVVCVVCVWCGCVCGVWCVGVCVWVCVCGCVCVGVCVWCVVCVCVCVCVCVWVSVRAAKNCLIPRPRRTDSLLVAQKSNTRPDTSTSCHATCTYIHCTRARPLHLCSVTIYGSLRLPGNFHSSLVPSPTPSFSSLLSTVKRGGPGTFPHVSMT